MVEQLGPEAVGDVPDARLHLLGHPERAGGLQHPGLPGVRHQEGVVVAEVRQRVGAGAALAVRAQEAGDHLAGGGHVTPASRPPLHSYLQRCPGGAASLQPQPQQVHPQQPRHEVMGGVAQPRPHSLVTDNYSFLGTNI